MSNIPPTWWLFVPMAVGLALGVVTRKVLADKLDMGGCLSLRSAARDWEERPFDRLQHDTAT